MTRAEALALFTELRPTALRIAARAGRRWTFLRDDLRAAAEAALWALLSRPGLSPGVARHLAFSRLLGAVADELRAQDRLPRRARASGRFEVVSLEDEDVAVPASPELLLDLARAVERLRPRTREIFRRRFFEGKTVGEVAAALGISAARVSQLSAAPLRELPGYSTAK